VRAVLAIVVLVVGAGCGGDDALSRAEWASQANAICLETLKKVEALGRPSNSTAYLRVTPKANELGREATERLRDLKAPAAIEGDVKRMIEGYENVVKLQDQVYLGMRAQRDGTEPPSGDYWRQANRALEIASTTDVIAKRLRANDCARDPWQAPSQA
jgi:hypothetical protein